MTDIEKRAAAIAIIKELFGDMCKSRRRLKPILTEIVKALDNNLFVDADSDEVKELLDVIVEMQEHFSEIDDLKSSAASRNVETLEHAIQNMDTKNVVSEMKEVLGRFKDLVCISEDASELESARKLQNQAKKLLLRADKLKADQFIAESMKFKEIAEKIDNPATMSPQSFRELQRIFPDNDLFVFSMMNKSLSFKSEEPIPPPPPEPPDEAIAQIKEINKLLKQCGNSLEQLIVNESDFVIETAEIKKQLTFKSFNNKVRSFVEHSESDFFPMLRNFITGRVFSMTEGFTGYNHNPIVPTINEKLFQWGAVDKVHMGELSFYYLNDYGFEFLSKMFPPKDGKPKKSARMSVSQHIRRFIFLSMFYMLGIDKKKYQLDGDPSRFWLQTKSREEGKPYVVLAFSLMLLDREWMEHLCGFLGRVDNNLDEGNNIKAIFLVTTLDASGITPWFRLFKKSGVKNLFSIFISGTHIEYIDINGDKITPEDMTAYLHGTEFDSFADYKSKYIKKTRGRPRKKPVEPPVEKKTDAEPPKRGRRKKNADTLQLNFNDYSETHVEETSTLETVTAIETAVETVEAIDTVEAAETLPAVDDAIEKVKPLETVQVSLPQLNIGDRQYNLPDEITNKFIVDESFFKEVLFRAVRLFVEGSAARGMLALHVFDAHADLDAVNSSPDSPLKPVLDRQLAWINGLTSLISEILGDPLGHFSTEDFIVSDFCETFFEQGTPFDEIDSEYIKGFFVTAFVVRQSYAPEMSGIFELRMRQNALLSDKNNAALKLFPSIKRLITLFKNFTEQTNLSFASSLHIDHGKIQAQFDAAKEMVNAVRQRAEAGLRKTIRHPRVKGLIYQLYDTDGSVRKLLSLENVTVDRIVEFCRGFISEDGFDLDGDVPVTDELFSQVKVGAYLDDIWDNIKVESHKTEKFVGVERVSQTNALVKALTALLTYAIAKRRIDSIGHLTESPKTVRDVLDTLKDILNEFDACRAELTLNLIGPAVLMLSIRKMSASIEEREELPFYGECLLGSKYLELTPKELKPSLDNFGSTWYSMLCRAFAYEHGVKDLSLEEAVKAAYETAVRSYDSGVLTQLEKHYREQLSRSDEELNRINKAVADQLARRIELSYRGFLDELALARHYARLVNSNDTEYYITAMETAKAHFIETKNAGLFERFIDAIRISITQGTKDYGNRMRLALAAIECEMPTADRQQLAAISGLIEQGRLNVAEDHFREGVDASIDNLGINDVLDDFLKSYESIFNVCVKNKNDSLEKIFIALKRDLNADGLGEFARAWQKTAGKVRSDAESAAPILLEHLSFGGAKFEQSEVLTSGHLHLKMSIETLGGELSIFNGDVKNLDLVCIAYSLPIDDIISVLRQVQAERTLCVINSALSRGEHFKLAQAMKLRAELKNIIVIDRVSAVYLTKFAITERREKFLKMTLPFANVNPYAEGNSTLFVGRREELERLRDMNGATFLVGGRQLGKTSLLDRIERLDHKPEEGSFVRRTDSIDDLEKLRAELKEQLQLPDVKRLILLLDINKTFASVKGTELEIFDRLRNEFRGRFKFILTAHHGSLQTADSVKLKPFTLEEATQFVTEPLSFLGMRIADVELLRSIFVQANYYPGLLNNYCQKLVEAFADNYEQRNFDAVNNPPYELDDEFLKNMLRRSGLQDEFTERLRDTLRDERDDYRYVIMLAVAFAHIYYDKNQPFDLGEIKDMCTYHDIDDLSDMNDEVLELLLEEMIELKLLRRSGEDSYDFYRFAYQHLIGNDDRELEARFKECLARRSKAE